MEGYDDELIRYRSQTPLSIAGLYPKTGKAMSYPSTDPRAGIDGALISPPRNAERSCATPNSLNLHLIPTLYELRRRR